jgi:26 proteasome complex subunit DSS1
MASSATTKTSVADPKPANGEAVPEKKPAVLEEDDEFEDFPIEGTYTRLLPPYAYPYIDGYSTRTELTHRVDWTEEETQIPGGNTHLWEESWDDDDTNEDFAVQLR